MAGSIYNPPMPTEPTFNEHELVWTDEKVRRYWDYAARNPSLRSLCFADEVGSDIVRRSRHLVRSGGKTLDYGCGSGGLLTHLFREGIACAGLDSSPDSLARVKERFSDDPLLQGTILATSIPNESIQDGTYDLVYFIETIEHILPEYLDAQVRELSRILAPGGYVFVSTPHDEDLQRSHVICPDCGAIYHRVQHTNSFNKEKLESVMRGGGFETVTCEPTFFEPATMYSRLKRVFRKMTGTAITPHLLYIGRKSS